MFRLCKYGIKFVYGHSQGAGAGGYSPILGKIWKKLARIREKWIFIRQLPNFVFPYAYLGLRQSSRKLLLKSTCVHGT